MLKRFPLAAVLTVREQREISEERALIAVTVLLKQRRAAYMLLERELAQLAATRAGERNQVFLAAHFQAAAARYDHLRAQQGELHREIKLVETRRTEQQERFLGARRDREMVTQLREKHENAWQAEQQKQETKRLDDIFSARRSRAV